jgi:hypothetical protein
MKRSKWFALVWAVGLGLMPLGSVAGAADEAPPAAPAFKLPDGWTQEDLQACMVAGTPGEMHKLLAGQAGKWTGKQTMWMAPGADPLTADCNSNCTSIMDGRFVNCAFDSVCPLMGSYKGQGIAGYDNVSKKFQSIWIDNHSSAMMVGTGSLSPDGKSITWKYEYTCPILKKPTSMREVETFTGPNSKTMEMFSIDPKSGKEFQMMKIELKRSGGDQASR